MRAFLENRLRPRTQSQDSKPLSFTPQSSSAQDSPEVAQKIHPDLRTLVELTRGRSTDERMTAVQRMNILQAQDSPHAHVRARSNDTTSTPSTSRITRVASVPALSASTSRTFGYSPEYLRDQPLSLGHAATMIGVPLSPPPWSAGVKFTPQKRRSSNSTSSPIGHTPPSPTSPSPPSRITPEHSLAPLPISRTPSPAISRPSTISSQQRRVSASASSSSGQPQHRTSNTPSVSAPFRVSFAYQPRHTPSPPNTLGSRSSRSRSTPPSIHNDTFEDSSPATFSSASPSSPPQLRSSASTPSGTLTRLAALVHSSSLNFTRSNPSPTLPESTSSSPLAPTKSTKALHLETPKEPSSSSRRPMRHASDSPMNIRAQPTPSASPATPFSLAQTPSHRRRGSSRGRFVSSPGHILTSTPHQRSSEYDDSRVTTQFNSGGSSNRSQGDSLLDPRRKSADWSSKAASLGSGSWQMKVAEEMVRLAMGESPTQSSPSTSPVNTRRGRHPRKDIPASDIFAPTSHSTPVTPGVMDVPLVAPQPIAPLEISLQNSKNGSKRSSKSRSGSKSQHSSRPSSGLSNAQPTSRSHKGKSRTETQQEDQVRVHVVGEDPDDLVEAWRLMMDIPTPRLGLVDNQDNVLFRFGSNDSSDKDKEKARVEPMREVQLGATAPLRIRRKVRERKTSASSVGQGRTRKRTTSSGAQRRPSTNNTPPPLPPLPSNVTPTSLPPISALPTNNTQQTPELVPGRIRLVSTTSTTSSKGRGKRPVELDDTADVTIDPVEEENMERVRKVSNVSERDVLGELPQYSRKRLKLSTAPSRLQSISAVAVQMSREASSSFDMLSSPGAGPSEPPERKGILSNKEERGASRASSRRSGAHSHSHSVSFSQRGYADGPVPPSPSGSEFPEPATYLPPGAPRRSSRRSRPPSIVTPGGTIPMRAILSPRPPSMAAGRTGMLYHLREPRRYNSEGSIPKSARRSSFYPEPPIEEDDAGVGHSLEAVGMTKKTWTEALPLQGWAFFIGFLLPFLWWAAALSSVREVDIENGDIAGGYSTHDIYVWRRRCRLMTGFSILVYVPVITLAVVFGR